MAMWELPLTILLWELAVIILPAVWLYIIKRIAED